MHRRDALQFLGSAFLAPSLAQLSAIDRWNAGSRLHQQVADGIAVGEGLSAAHLSLVTSLADMLIPRTDTPGAVDVEVPRFIDRLVAEWYSDDARGQIVTGLDAIDARARFAGGSPFVELDPAGRGDVITALDRRGTPPDAAESAWRTLRDQIVFGYLTSKEISERVRTTPIIPGRFDGCVPVGAPQ